jgi:DNA-binding transcriptional regulator LsrR (DeoR family)
VEEMKHNKLTKQLFKQVDKLYWNEGYEMVDIAEMIKVGSGTVSRMLSGKYIPLEVRRQQKKQQYAANLKAPKVEAIQAKIMRCKREELPSAKLNVAKVKEIRRSYFAGEKDQGQLAKTYKVNPSTICRIITGKKWKICKC